MNEWGPLAGLAGTWEGNDGIDLSFHNAVQKVAETGFLEKVQLKPFGPIENGKQSLYGLDYRMAAWRHGEEAENPMPPASRCGPRRVCRHTASSRTSTWPRTPARGASSAP
jgi:hypothetical protein